MAAMNRDLGKLLDLGYEYVFIDEVTLMPDFIDSAALFSDIYAAQGMKNCFIRNRFSWLLVCASSGTL